MVTLAIEQVEDTVSAWPEAARNVGIPNDILHAIQQTHLFV